MRMEWLSTYGILWLRTCLHFLAPNLQVPLRALLPSTRTTASILAYLLTAAIPEKTAGKEDYMSLVRMWGRDMAGDSEGKKLLCSTTSYFYKSNTVSIIGKEYSKIPMDYGYWDF